MDAVQAPAIDTPRDGAASQARVAQLLERHHSMLRARQLGDGPVGRDDFRTTVMRFWDHARDG